MTQLTKLSAEKLSALAEAMHGTIVEDDDAKPVKEKDKSALIKAQVELQDARRKIANLEIELKSARDSVPAALTKSCTSYKEAMLHAVKTLSKGTGVPEHFLIPAAMNGCLSIEAGKLVVLKSKP